jgi:hypothetical protein
MTFPDPHATRAIAPNKREKIPPIRGPDFVLEHTRQTVYLPSGKPVHRFDIYRSPREGASRIGSASLILDPDVNNVQDIGQVSARLERRSEDPGLLARIVFSLSKYAAQNGVKRVRIVVPRNARTAMEAFEHRLHCDQAPISEEASRKGLVGFEINFDE